jgi:hypothetical protein
MNFKNKNNNCNQFYNFLYVSLGRCIVIEDVYFERLLLNNYIFLCYKIIIIKLNISGTKTLNSQKLLTNKVFFIKILLQIINFLPILDCLLFIDTILKSSKNSSSVLIEQILTHF